MAVMLVREARWLGTTEERTDGHRDAYELTLFKGLANIGNKIANKDANYH